LAKGRLEARKARIEANKTFKCSDCNPSRRQPDSETRIA
jgi:hypothetical protein